MGKIGVWLGLYWKGLLDGEGGMWQSLSVVGTVMGTTGVRLELYMTRLGCSWRCNHQGCGVLPAVMGRTGLWWWL